MNLKLIDNVMKSYEDELVDHDKARLQFFRGLWGEMDLWAHGPVTAAKRYEMPSEEEVLRAFDEDRALFSFAPLDLSAERLASIFRNLRLYVLESGTMDPADSEALAGLSIEKILSDKDLVALAAKFPEQFTGEFFKRVYNEGLSEPATRLACLLMMQCLRVEFEPVALQACKIYPQDDVEHHHPMRCPVCGSAPAIARVGGNNPRQGRQKALYCSQCGAVWEFERVRCVRCGTKNQGHLHYFNLEGDDSHRLHMCDECGNYTRTVFLEENLKPFSFEVEEVVTARLDVIAHDPRFSKEGKRI